MPRRRQVKKARKRARHPNKKKSKYSSIQSVRVKQPGVICPDRMFSKLHYMDTSSRILATAGNPFGYIRYTVNGLYDPNPLILTAAVPGFKPIMLLYENYRVRGCKITMRASNQEAFPTVIVVWPTDQDQAGSVSQVYLQEMCGNAYAKFKHVSSKGGMDKAEVSAYIGFRKLIGTSNYVTSPEYVGTDSTNPAKLMYWNLGCYSMDGSNYTSANVPFECRMTFYCEFFNRRQQTS